MFSAGFADRNALAVLEFFFALPPVLFSIQIQRQRQRQRQRIEARYSINIFSREYIYGIYYVVLVPSGTSIILLKLLQHRGMYVA